MRIIALLALLAAVQSSSFDSRLWALAQDKPEIPKEKFEKLHALIKPQSGEFAWYDEIPWLTSIQEAREKAAKEDKPIVVWCSADGQPCGAT